jgi:anti-sigma factor RsiW
MNHLTMEQLLELRETGLEPGLDAARAHLAGCPSCQAEVQHLEQRVARVRALTAPRPSRDRFPEIRARYQAERRARRFRTVAFATLAAAASIALVIVTRPGMGPEPASEAVATSNPDRELATMMARSRELENTIGAWDPDSRVLDGRTAGIALRLEDQLSGVDRELELLGALEPAAPRRQDQLLRLWRERVGLLDALVDVHLTRASYAGL